MTSLGDRGDSVNVKPVLLKRLCGQTTSVSDFTDFTESQLKSHFQICTAFSDNWQSRTENQVEVKREMGTHVVPRLTQISDLKRFSWKSGYESTTSQTPRTTNLKGRDNKPVNEQKLLNKVVLEKTLQRNPQKGPRESRRSQKIVS